MPLIRLEAGGAVTAAQDWEWPDAEAALPAQGRVVLGIERYLAALPEAADGLVMGVQLVPEDDPARLAAHVETLDLIAIAFPRYTDGRGFSQAQLLRRRYGYRGELRATGHVLRDQVGFMARCGFDSFETSRAGLDEVCAALGEYRLAYQGAADRLRPIPARRHDDVSETRNG